MVIKCEDGLGEKNFFPLRDTSFIAVSSLYRSVKLKNLKIYNNRHSRSFPQMNIRLPSTSTLCRSNIDHIASESNTIVLPLDNSSFMVGHPVNHDRAIMTPPPSTSTACTRNDDHVASEGNTFLTPLDQPTLTVGYPSPAVPQCKTYTHYG